MSNELIVNISEYNKLLQISEEVTRLIQQARSANFVADHLANFQHTILDELSAFENKILTSSPENDHEAAEQLLFVTQIVRQKLTHRQFNQDTEIIGAAHPKSSGLLEIAKAMASVAQQL